MNLHTKPNFIVMGKRAGYGLSWVRPLSFRTIILAVFALMFLNGCATSEGYLCSAYRAGRTDARRELASGTLAVEAFGLPMLWNQEYSHLLQERYRIELRSVAGCIVDSKILGHAKGYNEIMRTEIGRRFGTNVWDATMADAQKLYEEKHGKIQRER